MACVLIQSSLIEHLFCLLSVLQDKDLEVCAINLKLDQLEAELQDLNSQESKDEASLAKVTHLLSYLFSFVFKCISCFVFAFFLLLRYKSTFKNFKVFSACLRK